MATKSSGEWYRRSETLDRLPFAPKTLARLVEEGRIGTLKVDGVHQTLYSVADVERLRSESIRPAKAARELATA